MHGIEANMWRICLLASDQFCEVSSKLSDNFMLNNGVIIQSMQLRLIKDTTIWQPFDHNSLSTLATRANRETRSSVY